MSEKNHKWLVWIPAVTACCVFLCLAARAMYPEWEYSPDADWARMWCYLAAAVAGGLLPWLISLRAVWSSRLGEVLGCIAAFGLFAVACGDCGDAGKELPRGVGAAVFLWACVGVFLLAALLPGRRRGLRVATAAERAGLRRALRVLVSLACGFGLLFLIALAGLCLAMGRIVFYWWEKVMLWALNAALFAPIFWPLAELLPRGRCQRACFRLFLYLLVPGLPAAAVVYFLEFHLISFPGDTLLSVRLLVTAVPPTILLFLWRYIHRRITESPQENVGEIAKSPQENVGEMAKSPQENVGEMVKSPQENVDGA